MTTGNFWDVTNPKKPVGEFDPDGIYDLPFDWASWLTGLADTYASHVFECDDELEVMSSAESVGVITARVRASGNPLLVIGQKYAVTCHITTTNGQKEDQTLYLKVREK